MIRDSDRLLRQSVKKLFLIISASKEMYDLLGPGRAERWFYWKYRSREQVSHRNELWTVVPLRSEGCPKLERTFRNQWMVSS